MEGHQAGLHSRGRVGLHGRKVMKLRFLVTVCALAMIAGTPTAAAAETPAPVYYLSLGDSLAAGTQPGRLFTNEGYADQLATLLRPRMPNLRLVKLGCPGETT